MQVNWSIIKEFITSRSLSIQWIDINGNYYLKAIDGAFDLDCILNKSLNLEEIQDFETNFKPSGNKKLIPDTNPGNNTDQFKVACIGFTGTATAGETTNIDFTMPDCRYIVGLNLVLKNHKIGDTVSFQVVHPQAGVLDEFATNWNVCDDEGDQKIVEFPLRGKIPQDIIIRLVYTSSGTDDVYVACNLMLHKKTV